MTRKTKIFWSGYIKSLIILGLGISVFDVVAGVFTPLMLILISLVLAFGD